MKELLVFFLSIPYRLKYGIVGGIKPPLGPAPGQRKSLGYIWSHFFWRIESAIYKLTGLPEQRHVWDQYHPDIRLRVFDLNTRWFWITVFYEPFGYGDPWLSIQLWKPHTYGRWIHIWTWEVIPNPHCIETGEKVPERDFNL